MSRRQQSNASTDRSAFARLGAGRVCMICHENPCHGHSEPDFLAGLVAAGVFFTTPGTRRQLLPGNSGVNPRMHLRPLD